MLKLECFDARERADIKRLLKMKTKGRKGGHKIYQVMPSRMYRVTPEQAFKKKFYPVWALLEAVGEIKQRRIRDAGTDIMLVPTCGVIHCVEPSHMEWVRKGAYRATFNKDLFEHPRSVWTPKLVARMKKLKIEGLSYTAIGKELGISHMTVWSACQHLGLDYT